MNPKNEQYLALTGRIFGRLWWGVGNWPTEGKPASVAFDYNSVLEREEQNGDVVGFYHTHPNMFNGPSSTDYNTMGGWTLSFGKPLACCIEGVNGLAAHWFFDDEKPHVTKKVWRFGNLFIGVVPDGK